MFQRMHSEEATTFRSRPACSETMKCRDARRIWFWHHSPLIFTGVMCFFFGDIVSEIVQSMLPVGYYAYLHSAFLTYFWQHKEFQIGDIVVSHYLALWFTI